MQCSIPKCKQGTSIQYLEYGLCERHWDTLSRDDLRRLLKITSKMMENTESEDTKD